MKSRDLMSIVGVVLVVLQFGLIALLGWQAIANLAGWPPALAALVLLAGCGLGLWTLSANRPGNFNIHPDPREGAMLITDGPYRYIRHPMYAAVVLVGMAAALIPTGPVGWLLLAALVLVLSGKALIEEYRLREQFPDYARYCERTWRFLPGLF